MRQRFNSLNEWLEWQESLHWTTIDLGLARIREVAENLQLFSCEFPVITVAGTNGKGSTVALLEAMLIAEGYRTGSYTSPFLYRYNERIKLSGVDAEDELICAAFEAIDDARRVQSAVLGEQSHPIQGEVTDDISLTYFEFATLAAMWIFRQQKVDVAILEVGMGGRLDAVNLWDADVAIITSIGIDHVKWLGDNRETIGYEKSGIMRRGKPVVSGDLSAPLSIKKYAKEVKALLYQAGEHFSWQVKDSHWELLIETKAVVQLPFPALKGTVQINNASTAIMALHTLKETLAISAESIVQGLQQVSLLGRLEKIQSKPDIILDVAHNSHAAEQLALWLSTQILPVASKACKKFVRGKTYALFSMLDDKNVSQVVGVMAPYIDHWFVSTVDDPRAFAVDDLVNKMKQVEGLNLNVCGYKTLEIAWDDCKAKLKPVDKVIVFGSFLVLSQFKVIF